MADNISSNTTNVSTTNANTNNLSNKPQDNDKYTAKRKDGKKNTQNQNVKDKSSSSTGPTPKKGEVKGNNNQNGKGNNDKEKTNPKEQAQQKAKEQAATTAMTALGVPAPVAKALSKPVANKLDQKGLLNENQRIKQGLERLNNIRNMTKVQEEKEDEEENENSTSSIEQAENVGAKIEQAKGIIKILKMIPPPAWGAIIGVTLFFIIGLILLTSISGVTTNASVMNNYSQDINEDSSSSNTSNTNPGTGELGYPTTSHTISAGYPYYSNGDFHGGIDFPVAVGTSVYAAEDGEVIIRKELNYSYGYYLYIKHDNGLCTLYAHNSELLVQQGDRVTKGQEIAKSGTTGNSTGPHVHFEVRTNCGVSSSGAPSGEYVDPNNYLAE